MAFTKYFAKNTSKGVIISDNTSDITFAYGHNLPTDTSNGIYLLSIEDEIVQVNSVSEDVSGNLITSVTRARENTDFFVHAADVTGKLLFTAGAINQISDTIIELESQYNLIDVTGAINLDELYNDVQINNEKISNVTHTGDVVGSEALTLDPSAISGKEQVSPTSSDYLLIFDETDSQLKKILVSGVLSAVGAGDVVGPESSVNNAISLFDSTTGKLIKESSVLIDISNNISGLNNITLTGTVDGRDVASDGSKLDGIESSATADQTDIEIETAYNNRVSIVDQTSAEAGTSTTAYRWTPQRVSQAIASLQSVLSVNSKTGAVTLVTGDISDTTSAQKYVTASDITKLGYISVTQAVNLDTMESNIATNNAKISYTDAAKVALIDVTGSINLDTLSAAVTANTAKVTNATHTGDVTGATELTIVPTAISGKTEVTPAAGDYFLLWDATDSTLKKGLIDSLIGGGGGGGDVVGPSSSTNNAISLFDSTTGKLIKNSSVLIDVSNNISGLNNITLSGTVDGRDIAADGSKLDGIQAGAQVNAVSSVNTKTGAVTLVTGDISDTTSTQKYVTASDITKLGHISVTQAVNLDTMESNIATNNSKISYTDAAKVALIDVTGSINLDTLSAAVTANTAKVTNATHTGDVTGATALTIVPSAISGKTEVTPVSGDFVLLWDATDSTLKKANVSNFGGSGSSGDVVGPVSSTDNAISLFDSTTGKLIKNSSVLIDVSNNISGLNNITLSGTVDGRDVAADGSKLDGIQSGAQVNAVSSVNTKTGAVTLVTGDISDTTSTQKYVTASDITKLGHISVSQAVNLDTMESDIATNNAKVTNATHTGDVTGATALTIVPTAISGKTEVTPAAGDYFLLWDATDSALKKGLINSLIGSGDVVGPSSATNNAISLFDSTTGKLLKDSVVTINAGAISGITSLNMSGTAVIGGNSVAAHTYIDLNTDTAYRKGVRYQDGGTVVWIHQHDTDDHFKLLRYVGGVFQNYPIWIDNTSGNIYFSGAVDITGSITLSGTVDGRDVAADGSKLDGIQSGAQVNAVSSVNTKTGAVTLVTGDISDTTSTQKYVTASDITKLGHISVSQAVNLDTMESDIATNSAKVTNATHTGDVTGATALTIVPSAISGKTEVTPATGDYILLWDATDSALKKGLVDSFIGGGGGGDVTGPASSTDNAIAVYDGVSGKLLKNSSVTVDTTSLTVPGFLTVTGQFKYAEQTALTTTGAVSWNINNNPSAKLNPLTGNVTLTISGISLNSNATLYIKQSASSSYTITWPSEITWAGGYEPDIATLSSEHIVSLFSHDGTGLIGSHISTESSTTLYSTGTVTDNSIVIYDGTTGNIVNSSSITIDATSNLVGVNSLTVAQMSRYSSQYALSTTGSFSWDIKANPSANIIAPTGDITLDLSGIEVNSNATLYVVQHGTTARTITWDADIDWAGGYTPDLSTLSSVHLFNFYSYDGTGIIGTHISTENSYSGLYNVTDTFDDKYFIGSIASANQKAWGSYFVTQFLDNFAVHSANTANTTNNISHNLYLDSGAAYKYTGTSNAQQIAFNAGTTELWYCDGTGHIADDTINLIKRYELSYGNFTIKDNTGGTVFNIDSTTGNITTVGTISGYLTPTSTNTLTNKRITKRVETVSDGATITINTDSYDSGIVTLAGNRILGVPSGTPTTHQSYMLEVIQDATGSRTLTLDTTSTGSFKFSDDLTGITLSTTAGKTDIILFVYENTLNKWLVTSINKGF